MFNQLDRLEKRSRAMEMIAEPEAAALLGISEKTLRNRVAAGELKEFYTVSPVNGNRFWHRSKIMGLETD